MKCQVWWSSEPVLAWPIHGGPGESTPRPAPALIKVESVPRARGSNRCSLAAITGAGLLDPKRKGVKLTQQLEWARRCWLLWACCTMLSVISRDRMWALCVWQCQCDITGPRECQQSECTCVSLRHYVARSQVSLQQVHSGQIITEVYKERFQWKRDSRKNIFNRHYRITITVFRRIDNDS